MATSPIAGTTSAVATPIFVGAEDSIAPFMPTQVDEAIVEASPA